MTLRDKVGDFVEDLLVTDKMGLIIEQAVRTTITIGAVAAFKHFTGLTTSPLEDLIAVTVLSSRPRSESWAKTRHRMLYEGIGFIAVIASAAGIRGDFNQATNEICPHLVNRSAIVDVAPTRPEQTRMAQQIASVVHNKG